MPYKFNPVNFTHEQIFVKYSGGSTVVFSVIGTSNAYGKVTIAATTVHLVAAAKLDVHVND
jgi:hypothetical protein